MLTREDAAQRRANAAESDAVKIHSQLQIRDRLRTVVASTLEKTNSPQLETGNHTREIQVSAPKLGFVALESKF